MDREDIIKLAREAGIGPVYGYESIERFAALVAAAEREACAKVCEEWGAWNNVAQDCAAAIRARGETRLFDDWGGGFPYKQKAWNGLTESQVMDFCKEARQIGVHSLLWKVNNLLKQQNT